MTEAKRGTTLYLTPNNWDEFERDLKAVEEHLTNGRRREAGMRLDPILYRGQSDADWDLETTLQRRSTECTTLGDYVTLALMHAEEISAATGQTWDLPDTPDLLDEIAEKSRTMHIRWPRALYAYLVYLRQYGFSSPLLDWTRSPYIAAYFAFQGAKLKTDRVVIYAYSETPELVKGIRGTESFIQVCGPFAATRARHFTQQAWYTVAVERHPETNIYTFRPHKDVIVAGEGRQDRLAAISLPTSMRSEVLKWLHKVNINDYTLFGTEESLLKTIDARVFDLDE